MSPDEWLEGKVVSIMNYGAFVRLEGDVDGMVHISQLDPHGERVDSVYNAVEVRFHLSSLRAVCCVLGHTRSHSHPPCCVCTLNQGCGFLEPSW